MQKKVILLIFFLLPAIARAREEQSVHGDLRRSYWQFLFLYEQTRAPGQSEFIIHPFYGRYRNMESAYTYHYILYPLFYSHGTNYWRKWKFLGLFIGDDFYHVDKGKDRDIMLSPLLHWGRGDSEEERYFGFFPFYGKVKDKISYAEIQYVLFPLYARWQWSDYKATAILWPFIMWGKGQSRDELRIFPFYSRKIHTGKYRRYSVLWPFFQWGYEDLDKKEPRSYIFFWPFYGRKWSRDGNLNVHSFLPLLIWPVVAYGSDKKSDSFDLKILWFLFQRSYSRRPYMDKLIVFPFYGRYTFGSFEEESSDVLSYSREGIFITPFFTRLATHSAVLEGVYTSLFPFYHESQRFFRRDRTTEVFYKVWPLYQYMRDSEGNSSFRSLVLWPGRADHFERVWGTFYSLIEYNRYANGDRYFSLLFRLYSQYWNEKEFHLFLLGLFEFHRTPEYWSFEILGGFLGYRRDYLAERRVDNVVRFLWMDL